MGYLMDMKYYLTPTEQIIMEVFRVAPILDKALLRGHLSRIRDKNLDKSLGSLVKRGELIRMKRGYYIWAKGKGLDTTLFMKAAPIVFGGYVAFDTALNIHGLLDYESFTIMIATPRRSGRLALGNYEIHCISMGDRCRGQIMKDGIWVSDLEKTFFDCFHRPDLAGGYQNITKALIQSENIYWNRFEYYLMKLGTDPMRQRVGYILSNILDVDSDRGLERMIDGLMKSVKTPTRLLPSGPLNGKLDDVWKVQDNLGKGVWTGWADG
jgi:predicted transcriptional regulator of viral defense system